MQNIFWPEQFLLFTFKCEIIVIDQSRVSGIKTSVSKMSEFAGNLPQKFISFPHLGVESNAHKLPEERESENPQDVAESIEGNTVEVGETNLSPAKDMSVFPNVPVPSKVGMSEEVEKDHELTDA